MNVPESWLRSFCDPKLGGQALADKLTMAGIEVEAYEPLGAKLDAPLVVAEVLAVEKHPNADKLTVCQVREGKDTVQVVCGAPNVRPGMKAVLAKIGTKALRGVESHGMLASAKELGISDDHSGLLELPATAKAGADFPICARPSETVSHDVTEKPRLSMARDNRSRNGLSSSTMSSERSDC